jgi:hypothetical protein
MNSALAAQGAALFSKPAMFFFKLHNLHPEQIASQIYRVT